MRVDVFRCPQANKYDAFLLFLQVLLDALACPCISDLKLAHAESI